jgi:hypothetical protein
LDRFKVFFKYDKVFEMRYHGNEEVLLIKGSQQRRYTKRGIWKLLNIFTIGKAINMEKINI